MGGAGGVGGLRRGQHEQLGQPDIGRDLGHGGEVVPAAGEPLRGLDVRHADVEDRVTPVTRSTADSAADAGSVVRGDEVDLAGGGISSVIR